MSKQGFTIIRTIDADRDAVWRAWTDPVVAARWWHPTGFTTDASTVRIDLRIGGEYGYVMTSPDGEQYPTGDATSRSRSPIASAARGATPVTTMLRSSRSSSLTQGRAARR